LNEGLQQRLAAASDPKRP